MSGAITRFLSEANAGARCQAQLRSKTPKCRRQVLHCEGKFSARSTTYVDE